MDNETLGAILIIGLAVIMVVMIGTAVFFFMRNKNRIKLIMIMKSGAIKSHKLIPKENKGYIGEDSYILNKKLMKPSAEWHEFRMPCALFTEGNPNQHSWDDPQLISKGQVDSKGVKLLLVNRLFYDLLYGDNEKIKEIATFALLIGILIGLIIIGGMIQKMPEQIGEIVAHQIKIGLGGGP